MPQKHSPGENQYSLFQSVRRKLNEISARYWTDLEIFGWLNEGSMYIVRKTKILKRIATITTSVGVGEYDLRSATNGFPNIMDISEDGVDFKINGSNRQPLDFSPVWKLNKKRPGWRDIANSVPGDYYFDKSTKVIGITPEPNASNAGAYLFISGYHTPKVYHAGTAEGGSATTIKLQVGSSVFPWPNPTNDYYNDLYIEIYGGTGAGQKVKITDYDAGIRTCTAAFSTDPDNTSIYGMVPEIPESMHTLIKLYTFWKAFSKGGSRTVLANNYRSEFFSELGLAISETIEADDEELMKETYR